MKTHTFSFLFLSPSLFKVKIDLNITLSMDELTPLMLLLYFSSFKMQQDAAKTANCILIPDYLVLSPKISLRDKNIRFQSKAVFFCKRLKTFQAILDTNKLISASGRFPLASSMVWREGAESI